MSVVGIIIAIIVFSVLVITHEFGHFVMARACKVRVTEFSIGFGPRLFSFHALGTVFSVKLIPFGGSCAMLGEDAAGGGEISSGGRDEEGGLLDLGELKPEDIPEDSFLAKKPWQKALISFFGPFFNFILAFILGLIVVITGGVNPPRVYITDSIGDAAGIQIGDEIVSINGEPVSTGADISLIFAVIGEQAEEFTVVYERDGEEYTTTYSGKINDYKIGINYNADESEALITAMSEGVGANAAGIEPGDVITEIDGTAIKNGEELSAYFDANPLTGEELEIKVLRDGEEYSYTVTPYTAQGISLGFGATAYREDATFLTAIKGGFDEVVYGVKAVIYSLRMLFTGQASVNDMSGPVGIVTLIGDTVEASASEGAGVVTFNVLSIAILLSANLAIVNLLPLPALDGGRLVVSIAEWITRKKIPYKVESIINMVGLGLLLLLIFYITGHDIFKLFQ